MVLKRRFFVALMLAAVLATSGRGAAEAAHTDMVRLHVVAADDTPGAQALKLRVRDACLGVARELLADCGDAEAAWAAVRGATDAFSAAAEAEARRQGYAGAVRAEAGEYDFPDRVYGGALVPAGRYRALRVVLGAGAGRNWWCVLYPCLCLPEECRDGAPVAFHSALLDWLRDAFGGRA